MIKQLDIFGGAVDLETPEKNQKIERPEPKKTRMQKQHGIYQGHTCDECSGLQVKRLGQYKVLKCRFARNDSSGFTDIKRTDTACGFFYPKEKM